MINELDSSTYTVICSTCKQPFDALKAVRCNCLTTERTILCPHCGECFCKAPDAFKNEFWLNAPRSLLNRKKEEQAEKFTYVNPQPEQAIRPLVLVVDDDLEIQKIACRLITALGYGFIFACNGQEGLNLVRLYQPDLVLSDALMPKLDGRELCKQIKTDQALSAIKVIVMTSLYKQAKHKMEAFKTFHVDDFLSKPLDPLQLREVLQKHCGTPDCVK
jgi:CheY-like chemotaxis protein